jgi:hypothetical protein
LPNTKSLTLSPIRSFLGFVQTDTLLQCYTRRARPAPGTLQCHYGEHLAALHSFDFPQPEPVPRELR